MKPSRRRAKVGSERTVCPETHIESKEEMMEEKKKPLILLVSALLIVGFLATSLASYYVVEQTEAETTQHNGFSTPSSSI